MIDANKPIDFSTGGSTRLGLDRNHCGDAGMTLDMSRPLRKTSPFDNKSGGFVSLSQKHQVSESRPGGDMAAKINELISQIKDLITQLQNAQSAGDVKHPQSSHAADGVEGPTSADSAGNNNDVMAQILDLLQQLIQLLQNKTGSQGASGAGDVKHPQSSHAADRAKGPTSADSAGNNNDVMAQILDLLQQLIQLLQNKTDSGHGAHGSKRAGGSNNEKSSQTANTDSQARAPAATQHEKTAAPKTASAATGADNSKAGDVIVVNEPIVVDGGVFDGKGATYTASSKLGDGSQSETQKPVFILKNGATLKNVNIGENGADGVHVYNGATVENVNWLNVGEDALTIKTPGDLNVIGGSARGADDKVFQINADSHINIQGFNADTFQTFVRTNGGKQLNVDVTIDGGNFTNGTYLFRTDSTAGNVNFTGDIALNNVENWTRRWDDKSGV